MTTQRLINFGPLASNVLDCVDRDDLRTPDGQPVRISIGGRVVLAKADNLTASLTLNAREVGVMA